MTSPREPKRTSGIHSPLVGKFFLVQGDNPLALLFDGTLSLPVFSGPQQIADAERWFSIPRGRVLEITDGDRFYNAFHHDFRIIIDPRIVDGQCRYDLLEVDPAPREMS
jgi:hypothetical protein